LRQSRRRHALIEIIGPATAFTVLEALTAPQAVVAE
jgi:hypothetical protein